MFFLIGGIQPKTVTLDQNVRICPACGLAQARLKRVDHYVSVFFIPLFSVKKGRPVVMCDRCGASSPPEGDSRGSFQAARRDSCPQCGFPVARDFRYCPSCGTRI